MTLQGNGEIMPFIFDINGINSDFANNGNRFSQEKDEPPGISCVDLTQR
jgi:hypothetical protein